MKKICLITFSLLIAISCKKDFVVKDIKDQTVTVNAPANNLVTTSNKVTFWWEQVDGAEKYNIQVVKPDFTSVAQIVSDTSIAGTKYSLTLQPGSYQWRIRAVNNGGSTAFQTYNLKVDTTSNLSSITVSVINPISGFLTGNKSVNFSWNMLNAAKSYQVLILNSSSGTVKDTTTALTTFTFTFPSAGAYSWKVRALNDFSISQYNAAQTLTIDLTAPAAPILISPAHNAVITPTNNLVWNRVGAPDAKYEYVYIASDSLFANVISLMRSNTSTITINTFTAPIPATSSVYWWRLRSSDSAGNLSVYSSQLKFKLNP
jgi:predicted phage tail protein